MINFPGPEKIFLLVVIALVVLGPSRLPSAARTAGKWIGELRKLTSRFQEELNGALSEPKDALTAAVGDLRNEVGGWRNEMAGLTRSVAAPMTAPTPLWPTPNAPAGNGNGATYAPSGGGAQSVPSTLASPGLPSLPPAPDDPSLN